MTLAAKLPNWSKGHEKSFDHAGLAASKHQRYVTLDALRGIAALAVVVVHIPMLFGLPYQTSSGLAVDLFFILSGFVLEHAYGNDLRREMSFSTFIRVRMIRLYPLYLIGVALYALFCFARPNVAAQSVVPGTLLALVYLPTPPAISFDPTFLFPVNPVSWSLFCEIFVNILYALFMVRMGSRSLISIIIAFGVALLVEKAALSVDALRAVGPWLVLVDGIPRSLFSFFAGVIIYRLAPNRSQAGSVIIIVLLVAIFALNFGKNLQPIYDLIIIMVVFPALLFFASLTKADGRQSQVYVLLGAISYPMYVIHMPIVLWVSAIFPRLFGTGLASFAPWSGFALIGFIALVSFLLDRTYDQPVRRWLKMVTVGGSARTS